jgi:hypothetical protein
MAASDPLYWMGHSSGWILSRRGNSDEAQMLGKQTFEASESRSLAGMLIAVGSCQDVLL